MLIRHEAIFIPPGSTTSKLPGALEVHPFERNQA